MLGVLVDRSVERDLVRQIHDALETEAVLLNEIARPYMSSPPDSTLQHLLYVLGARTGTRFTVIRADGVVLADSREDPAAMDNHRMRPEVLEALAKGVGSETRYSHTLDREMTYVAVPMFNGEGVSGFARAAVPLTAVRDRLSEMRAMVLLGGLTAAVLALLIGFLVARSFTRPIARMTAAADAIASGDYDQRLAVDRSDEIGRLAAALNSMTGQLRDHIHTITADKAKTVAILAGMVEGVVAVDSEERIVHINSAAEGILGIREEESLGKRIWEATRVREVSDSVAEAMRGHHVSIGEARIPSPEKEQVIQTIAAPLRDAEGGLDGAIVVLHDVSELRQLEKVRRDFIANISHELKTPLAAIRGLVETLIDDDQMDKETHDRFLTKIRDQSSRLSNLIVDLLTISRLESHESKLEFEPTDLRVPVAESYRNLSPHAEASEIAVEPLIPDEPVTVEGDPEALRELVDNLLSNAVKYTPRGGRVQLRLFVEAESAILEIEDTGIGIAPEDQSRVFERFYRVDKARSRRMGGTGLGLSIVKHVALAHGGNVSVRSETGRGSTFRVQIPLNSDSGGRRP
jgi:two-component system phosphate regulon sensor histidine kinase PhoR